MARETTGGRWLERPRDAPGAAMRMAFCIASWKLRPMAITSPTDFIDEPRPAETLLVEVPARDLDNAIVERRLKALPMRRSTPRRQQRTTADCCTTSLHAAAERQRLPAVRRGFDPHKERQFQLLLLRIAGVIATRVRRWSSS